MIDLKDAIHEINHNITFEGAEMLTEGECAILLEELARLQALTASIPLDRLEAICAAEREGRCVVLPCKVGDTVWALADEGVIQCRVTEFTIKESGIAWVRLFSTDDRLADFHGDCFGKTVFLSRAQAEAAKEKNG
jgi:hypothetical protein